MPVHGFDMALLRDHSGRWSPEKIGAFALAITPAVWLIGRALAGDLGARPVKEAIVYSGTWALRLLFVTLVISPARRIFFAPRFILGRRTLGLAAFGYGALHLSLYAADQMLDLTQIVSEIALRFYLTIGAIALAGLMALAATSSDHAVHILGSQRWNRLHRLSYPIATLAAVHFLLQSKTDTWEPMLMGSFLVWLLGYRILQHMTGKATPARLVALAILAAALTAFSETAWHAAATGVNPWRILAAHLDPQADIRPAWWVLVTGLLLAAAARWSLQSHHASMRISSSRAASGAILGQSPS